MKCPHCNKEIPADLIASALGRKGGQSRSPAKQAASRENGKKGGHPELSIKKTVHLGAGFLITATGKLQKGGHAISLSAAHCATILGADEAGDKRLATVKAKRYWHGMKRDPVLTPEEEKTL